MKKKKNTNILILVIRNVTSLTNKTTLIFIRHICYNCHYQFIEHYPTRLPNKNELNI